MDKDPKNKKNSRGFSKEQMARIGYSGLTGGVGNAAKRVADIKYAKAVEGKANRVARRIAARRNQKEEAETPEKKMTGPVFYILLFIIIVDEIIDVAFNLTGILAVLTVVTHLFITFIIMVYLIVEKVSIFTSRKMALWVVTLTIETIPILNTLPGYTFGFILTRIFENNDLIRNAVAIRKGKIGKVASSRAKRLARGGK